MLHRNINFKVVGLAVLASLIGGVLIDSEVDASSCDDEEVSCVEVNFGTMQGDGLTVTPGLSYYDSTKFYLPVEIGLKNTSRYTVKVYGSGSSLISGDQFIPSVGESMSYTEMHSSKQSQWGIRWNLGNTVEDKDTNYHKVPSSSEDADSIVVENALLVNSANTTKKQLTLGFAVAVGPDQPSGSYTNTITVAVVATASEARSFFDISTMQEMTPEICANTTTPSKDVKGSNVQYDTNAMHEGDTSYVPETTLIDTRDNKDYLVRKLADGNCWMSQNLSLNLSTSKALTSTDTDLTSKSSWTPTHNTQTNTGVVWGQNDDKDHSSNYGWSQHWAGGTSFTASGNTSYGGTAGYAQRGSYYNWFAATAGSGKSTDINTTTDGDRIINGTVQDSICPKGWTLPVGGETAINSTDGSVKSFYNLVQVYTGNTGNFSGTVDTLYAAPLGFSPAGFYYYGNGGLGALGEGQFYWSGTANTAANALSLSYDSSTYNGAKSLGYPIRCIAR